MSSPGKPKVKILRNPIDNPTITEEITDWIKLTMKKGLEAKSNTAEFILKNNWKKWVNSNNILRIKHEDTIKIYVKMSNDQTDVDTSIGSPDLMMIGQVIGYSSNFDEQGTFYKVQVADNTHIILNQLWAKVYSSTSNFNAPQLIADVINQTTNRITTKITINFVNFPSKDGIQITRPNGSAFPVKSITRVWKPVFEWISDLSQMEYTNSELELQTGTIKAGRPYVFYVDENNKIHWYYPADDQLDFVKIVNGNLNDTSNNLVAIENGHLLENKTFDVINTVYFKVGTDLNNNGIVWYWFDPTLSGIGKQTYRPYTQISKDLKFGEARKGNLVINTGTGNYDVTAGYPKTTSWGAIVVNFQAYNTEFRAEAKRQGTLAARKLTSKTGSPRWKGNITFTGFKFNPGDVINYINEKQGIKNIDDLTNVNLRIADMTHDISKEDWTTTVNVAEDGEELTE